MVTEVSGLLLTSRGLEMEFQPDDDVIRCAVEEYGRWEEPVARAIEKFCEPGWTVLDLGAHVGYFTLVAAQRGRDVIAVEADPETAAILQRNVDRNGLSSRVEVAPCGVSTVDGEASLVTDDPGNPGGRHLADHGEPVIVQRLETLLGDRRPEFIKVDIEGFENAVFADSASVLEHAQVVVFEAGSHARRYGYEPMDVVRTLEAAGFTVTYMDGMPLDDQWTEALEAVEHGYINLLARKRAESAVRGTILLCAWRDMKVESAESLMKMRDLGWGYAIVRGDALITRSRSRAVSHWYRHSPDEDVFLMVDDDVVFRPEHAEQVLKLARDRHTIACAAYPVKDGGHTACRRFPGQDILFGPDSPPVEVQYPATGFMAVSRDVLDAMLAARKGDMPEYAEARAMLTLADEQGLSGAVVEGLRRRLEEPVFALCGEGPGAFWPFFDTFTQTWQRGSAQEHHEYLSEDYAFGEMARRLGFTVWLDPSVILYHLGTYPYNVHNMKHVQRVDGIQGPE